MKDMQSFEIVVQWGRYPGITEGYVYTKYIYIYSYNLLVNI